MRMCLRWPFVSHQQRAHQMGGLAGLTPLTNCRWIATAWQRHFTFFTHPKLPVKVLCCAVGERRAYAIEKVPRLKISQMIVWIVFPTDYRMCCVVYWILWYTVFCWCCWWIFGGRGKGEFVMQVIEIQNNTRIEFVHSNCFVTVCVFNSHLDYVCYLIYLITYIHI